MLCFEGYRKPWLLVFRVSNNHPQRPKTHKHQHNASVLGFRHIISCEDKKQKYPRNHTVVFRRGEALTSDKRTIVLDTSAFIAGFDPFSITDEVYSVPAVERELAHNSLPWTRFKTAVESGKLGLKMPKEHFVRAVRESSKAVGDVLYLSEVDLQVLALALELKSAGHNALIVTDDYSIQNVANQIGVEFASLMTFGIRFRLHWIMYCPACGRKYPPDYKLKSCEVCGTGLKRKPLKKTPV